MRKSLKQTIAELENDLPILSIKTAAPVGATNATFLRNDEFEMTFVRSMGAVICVRSLKSGRTFFLYPSNIAQVELDVERPVNPLKPVIAKSVDNSTRAKNAELIVRIDPSKPKSGISGRAAVLMAQAAVEGVDYIPEHGDGHEGEEDSEQEDDTLVDLSDLNMTDAELEKLTAPEAE